MFDESMASAQTSQLVGLGQEARVARLVVDRVARAHQLLLRGWNLCHTTRTNTAAQSEQMSLGKTPPSLSEAGGDLHGGRRGAVPTCVCVRQEDGQGHRPHADTQQDHPVHSADPPVPSGRSSVGLDSTCSTSGGSGGWRGGRGGGWGRAAAGPAADDSMAATSLLPTAISLV